MELQHELEREEPLLVSNKFTRAVERVTGTELFPSIDAVALAAVNNERLFAMLLGEVTRAQNQGVHGQKYSPDLYGVENAQIETDSRKLCNDVYERALAHAQKKELPPVPSKTPILHAVRISNLSPSGRYQFNGGLENGRQL